MTCVCPKCRAAIDLEHDQIAPEGITTKCASCNAKVQIVCESFAKMAYYQEGHKNCGQCGNPLGHTLHCPSCNAIYPKFFIAADPAELRRRAKDKQRQGMLTSLQGIEFSLPNFKSRAAEKPVAHYTPERKKKSATTDAPSKSPRKLVKIVSLLIILAIIGGGYTAYAKHKSEQQYMDNYFKVLYGIKAGTELSRKISTRMAKDWKSAMDSGQAFAPRATTDEIQQLTDVNNAITKYTQQLNPPSEKFAAPLEQLGKLKNNFDQTRSYAVNPPATLLALNEAMVKSDSAFIKQSQELKASFPEEMTAELPQAKLKYKVLKDF